ncbi:hypothetical protein DSO57_1030357 [Entomophthora muscae]|uniref:Uncharacterized protein n=1 Tax=Entomophthora muscae TaxID=34485 RepID=A0ACC2T110_9FUNG|nr:hypothetical protein DSO57_1030357 [Entomophthora muscae]
MTPPLTPRPNPPQESVAINESTSTQIFGVMYITLTRLIDSMVPAQSCGGLSLLGPRAVSLQALRNPPQVGSLKICTSQSPFGASMFFVAKKDRTLKLVTDY